MTDLRMLNSLQIVYDEFNGLSDDKRIVSAMNILSKVMDGLVKKVNNDPRWNI